MTDQENQEPGPAEPDYVGTFRWTDTHGDEGALDILAAATVDPPVQARTPDAAEVVAVVDSDGRPEWSDQRLRDNGVDSAAARNDLIEVIHQTYRDLTEPA